MGYLRRVFPGLFAVWVCLSAPMAIAAGPAPSMLADIGQGSNAAPSHLARAGSTVYFLANDGVSGTELWKTDGVKGTTRMVKDIWPGKESSVWPVSGFPAIASTIFFLANDGVHGYELWKSNGTKGGTVMVADLVPGAGSNYIRELAVVGSRLFFSGLNADSSSELWVTDGTPVGTRMVKDINPAGSSFPEALTEVDGLLYFRANDGSSGYELWRSDGTNAGTHLVRDVQPGTGSSYPQNIAGFNGMVLFSARQEAGTELWRTDGTATGTQLVKDIHPSGSSSPSKAVSLGSIAYFSADHPQSGRELWRTDGTSEGTWLVKDIDPRVRTTSGILGSSSSPYSSRPGDLRKVGERILFIASDDRSTELWKVEGDSVSLVKDINVYGAGVWGLQGAVVQNILYFAATDSSWDTELWRTDGTAQGTFRVADVNAVASSMPNHITEMEGNVYFTSYTGEGKRDLFRSDGTAGGTRIIDIAVSQAGVSSFPASLGSVGDLHFFSAEDPVAGREIFISDGTKHGTKLLKDINRGPGSSFPTPLGQSGGLLFFGAYDPDHGHELWKTDGTPAGTTLVKDINPGHAYSIDYWMGADSAVLLSGELLFSAFHPDFGRELWKTDGTTGGTVLVKDIEPAGESWPYDLTTMGGFVYFGAYTGQTGDELFRSDGTAAGTVLVSDINSTSTSYSLLPEPNPPTDGSDPGDLTPHGNHLYFSADDGETGWELWRTDGVNTELVRDIHPAGDAINAQIRPGSVYVSICIASRCNQGSYPWDFESFGSNLYFTADDGNGYQLWSTDGTSAGTNVVGPLDYSWPMSLTATQKGLFFVALDTGIWEDELWVIRSVGSAPELLTPDHPVDGSLVSSGGYLWFAASDPDHGTELWRSDGTIPGTRIVSDIHPGATSSYPAYLTVSSNSLFFSADNGTSGQEPWGLRL